MADSNNEFVIRRASAVDLHFPTRFAVENNWRPFGPGDLACAYKFDPSGFFVGEENGVIVSHMMAIKYPGHSIHLGSYMVHKEHRGKGYGEKTLEFVRENIDLTDHAAITIGVDALSHMIPKLKANGFHIVWENFIAMLNFEKIITNLKDSVLAGYSIKPIRTVDVGKLIQYDSSVYGTSRHKLIENWIAIPGSMGWVAFNETSGDIVGYTVVRPIILRAGMEIGCNMAPLFADNDSIASALLKVAADACLQNEAVPAKDFMLIYAKGSEHSQLADHLFDKVEAEYIPFATRMYTKGTPIGMQLSKIYGVTHPAFD